MDEKTDLRVADDKTAGVKSGTFLKSKCLLFLLIAIHVLWFGMGVAKILIGAMYIDDCDRLQMIPIWLIVDAFIPILFVVGFVPYYKESTSDTMRQYGRICLIVALIVHLAWLACGCILIFPDWNADEHCDNVLESFTKAAVIVNCSVIGSWGQIVFRLIFVKCCSKKTTNCGSQN
ncbi:uncharacterized protein LOC123531258 [Mercenaria mercenaria]|uniref:uncharacterized protein LOC123531258 n=1 Tax=Mercenaria mercenaria TaxID=6596 RepID=UPI00234F2E44|nr:uncharacterized protein LOC123531258 [Mercenaria mercenaria]XP_053374657.1 uncharacterized protein LOC123531258 [Mercenaria mercenaria]